MAALPRLRDQPSYGRFWAASALSDLIALARPGEWALILLGVGEALFGVGIGLSNPNTLGFRQAITLDALQGRMNATIRSLNWGVIAVGAPLDGVLADQLGFRSALWIGVAGFAVASASPADGRPAAGTPSP